MRRITEFVLTFSALGMLACTGVLVGCSTDENIDLGDVDTTIGIGSDGLEFPSNSTRRSPLGDLLKTNEGDAIDTLSNGDYRFLKGDTLNPATPKVKEAVLAKQSVTPSDLTVPITPEMMADYTASRSVQYEFPTGAPQEIATFNYQEDPGNDHHQIDSIKEADITGNITIDLGVTALKSSMNKVSLKVFLPKFFGVDKTMFPSNYSLNENIAGEYQELLVSNIPTNSDFILNLKLNKLKNVLSKRPTGSESYMLVNSTDLELQGKIKTKVVMNTINFVSTATVGSNTVPVKSVDMGDGFHVTHAEGWFNPDINIEPKSTDIGSIPEFLKDDRVSVILSNPTLKIELDNNIDIEGLLKATLVGSYDDGNGGVTYRTLDVTSAEDIIMKQAPAGSNVKSTIMLCRRKGTDPAVQYIEKRNDSNPLRLDPIAGRTDSLKAYDVAALLSKIPKHIDILLEAHANNTKIGSIDLYKEGTEGDPEAHGCTYAIKPIYEFMAPLTMERGSTIVYSDTVDDFNKDLVKNQINFYNDGYLQLEASIDNNTPLELVISNPKAVGVKDANGIGHEISDVKVEITDEQGNRLPNGLTVYRMGDSRNRKLYLKAQGNMKELDGIVFEVVANATQATAETLNASRHTVQLKDIKLKLNGRITINLDN